MSILPQIYNDVSAIQGNIITKNQEKYAGKRTYKFDFEKGEFEVDIVGNVIKTKSPEQLLKQVVDKILHDMRYRYRIYPDYYGNELSYILSQDDPFDVLKCEIERVYIEALAYHPLIENVSNFRISNEDDKVFCIFTVTGNNGAMLNVSEVIES